ncbi:ATP-binding protein [Natrialba sp. INN-245]|uniref:sensor histidine kinase n=1 Tax=Natrialba sp. INN-245 TaxID=2690967 RepID=UPI0013135EFC|nr:ATP-binding protein [Natrialba sp. INN-245]MWV38791.1 GHKL domain-containing protein [Natrialba sp. INN-245]
MTGEPSTRRTIDHGLPYAVSAFGGLSGVVLLSWLVAFRSTLGVEGALGAGTVALFALGLLWGGWRLERGSIGADQYGRIAGWCLAGLLALLLVGGLALVVLTPDDRLQAVVWVHVVVTTGAFGGVAVGVLEARAIRREAEAAANAAHTDRLAHERELLRYLNDLLRHEVLNSVQIVRGHATMLLDGSRDDRTRTRLEAISQESDALTAVVEDVRLLLDANECPDRLSTVDLAELLEATVSAARDEHAHADIDTSLPDTAVVVGNDGIERIFENLLENAIVHNDSETPHVDLSVETTPEAAIVAVSDDGPGIPEQWRGSLFERKSRNHGLGLYLVRILADRYGGTVELAETGPTGTTVVVTLPRPPDSADRDESIDTGEAALEGRRIDESAVERP